jgi:hypothetical protein
MVYFISYFFSTTFCFCFLVELSMLLQVLKLPGSAQEWKASYQTVQEILGGQKGMEGMVWNSLQFVGAPGSQEEWNSIVKKVLGQLVFLKNFFSEIY